MSLFKATNILQLQRNVFISMQCAVQSKGYAVAALGGKPKKALKKGKTAERVKMEVCTDVNKLVTYCCGSNYRNEGEDVLLGPDSEYPDWLWNLHTGPRKPLEELDPNTKEYYRRLREEGLKRNNKLLNYTRLSLY